MRTLERRDGLKIVHLSFEGFSLKPWTPLNDRVSRSSRATTRPDASQFSSALRARPSPGQPGPPRSPRHGVSLDPRQRPLSPLAVLADGGLLRVQPAPERPSSSVLTLMYPMTTLYHARGINESGDSFTAAGGFRSSTPATAATGMLPSRARLQARRHRRLYSARGQRRGSALASVIPAASRKESIPDLMQRQALKFGCCPRVVYVFSSGPRPERLMWGGER